MPPSAPWPRPLSTSACGPDRAIYRQLSSRFLTAPYCMPSSRAAVLSGYVRAFTERTGMLPAGDAETVAARFLTWLAETSQPPDRGMITV